MLCLECSTPLWPNYFCTGCWTIRPNVIPEKEMPLCCPSHGEFDPKIFSLEEDGRLCPFCSTLLSSKVNSPVQISKTARDEALKKFFTGMCIS